MPASTVKLLAALAVADGLDLGATMATRVVALRGSTDLVLVAGGDTLLAPGKGDPDAVAGRAGLADLAAQVADALAPTGAHDGRLRLDLSWAPGPRYPATWNPNDVRDGFTQAVVMTGLATQLPAAGRPAPQQPEREVADGVRRGARAARGHRDAPAGADVDEPGTGRRRGARERRVGRPTPRCSTSRSTAARTP